jgi:hypothetical protein
LTIGVKILRSIIEMQNPILPTSSQTLECFRICQQLTLMYLPVYLVRLDERTSEIAILAGEEVVISINRDGGTTIS